MTSLFFPCFVWSPCFLLLVNNSRTCSVFTTNVFVYHFPSFFGLCLNLQYLFSVTPKPFLLIYLLIRKLLRGKRKKVGPRHLSLVVSTDLGQVSLSLGILFSVILYNINILASQVMNQLVLVFNASSSTLTYSIN